MFQDTIAECRSIAASASEQIKKIRGAAESERAGISASAFSLLKQADENLKSLQLEAKAAPVNERAQLAKEEEALRKELRAAAQELEVVRRELLLGASAGGSTDRLFLAREERKRAAAVTHSLRTGCDRLKESNRTMEESEKIGIETLLELRKQRETIMRVQDRTSDLGHNLNDASDAVKELEKPACAVM
mmetsp:Transcript_69431/g.136280  ORF Transcript_69431/g.136280 Transcript_69431/m.136280 type:complete len:190 (+) Transcript_69431:105-674(+)